MGDAALQALVPSDPNLTIMEPAKLEAQLNNIHGIVTNGLFALRPADVPLLGHEGGVRTLTRR